MTLEQQVAAAMARVATLDRQALLTLRTNAERYGAVASPLLASINARLIAIGAPERMAGHRLEFARCMLRIVERSRPLAWISARDLFLRAQLEHADNPYVVWMQGNSARQIPLTKALADVLPEFPNIAWRKDGTEQSARVYYRRLK